MPTYALHTLGCKLNYAESATLARTLSGKGYVRVDFPQKADIFILNTCTVTDNADKECLRWVRKLRRAFPASWIILTGCLAAVQYEQLSAVKEVDLVLGARDKFRLPEFLDNWHTQASGQHSCEHSIDPTAPLSFTPSFSLEGRTRAFLKVQDGCDYNCTYCIIPQARGEGRSDSIEQAIANAQYLQAQGVKEIVLTGVNLGTFGEVAGKGRKLLTLLEKLLQETDIPRYRLSSIEPNLLTEEMIGFIADNPRMMPHFHIPLQSGSDKILSLMRRRYNTKIYAQKAEYIKKFLPEAAIGADVMTGFPQETDFLFQETYDFLSALPVSYLHTFTYSERKETLAATMGGAVPYALRKERNARLRALSVMKQEAFKALFLGAERPVLFEQANNASLIDGYTDNYIRIRTMYKEGMENQLLNWVVS